LDPDVTLLNEAATTKASFLAHLKLYHGLALHSSDPQFTFVGKVGSATATFLIDTGANASCVSKQFARRHSLQTAPSSRQR
jgi:predicted aspartyl protease